MCLSCEWDNRSGKIALGRSPPSHIATEPVSPVEHRILGTSCSYHTKWLHFDVTDRETSAAVPLVPIAQLPRRLNWAATQPEYKWDCSFSLAATELCVLLRKCLVTWFCDINAAALFDYLQHFHFLFRGWMQLSDWSNAMEFSLPTPTT